MAKKGVLVLVLAVLVAGGVFAQGAARNAASGNKYWLAGEVSFLGVGLRGDYALSDTLSLTVNAYFSTILVATETGANVGVRFFPYANAFYTGISVGYSAHGGISSGKYTYKGEEFEYADSLVSNEGLGIVPEIGARFKVGNGGFYLNPLLQVPITLGTRIPTISDLDEKLDLGFGVDWGIRVAIGLGYTF